jgi:hypothetical protein
VRDHLDECDSCAERWARLLRLDAALGALRTVTANEAPGSGFEPRLLEAYRMARAGHVVADAGRPRWSWARRPWIGWAAAVIAAFAVGAAVAIHRVPAAAPSDAALQARVLGPDAGTGADRPVADLAATAPADGGDASNAALDAESGFVVLPYGPPTLEDPVHLVQVDVPTRTLLDFSMELPAERAQLASDDDVIAVDVLVDEFGMARAVRLVEPTEATAPDLDPGPMPVR